LEGWADREPARKEGSQQVNRQQKRNKKSGKRIKGRLKVLKSEASKGEHRHVWGKTKEEGRKRSGSLKMLRINRGARWEQSPTVKGENEKGGGSAR